MYADSAEGRNVLAVPEFSFYEVLRPFDGFVDVYEGTPIGSTMIMLSPGGRAYDRNAERGVAGYDPNLVRGHPVIVGQRVIVLLPPLVPAGLNEQPYVWKPMWRLRNAYDHRIADGPRPPYHLPKQGQGVPDTTGPNPGPRVVLPAVWNGVVYMQTEPLLPSAHARQNLRAEDIRAGATRDAAPLMPDGSVGVIQQGILPSTAPLYTQPWFVPHEIQAIGDELLLGLTRDVGTHPDWDFADYDAPVAEYLGSNLPDLGALVSKGVSP